MDHEEVIDDQHKQERILLTTGFPHHVFFFIAR